MLKCTAVKGEYVILGQSLGAIERNILYGERKLLHWVGEKAYKKGANTVVKINESTVYCIGADNVVALRRIPGMTLHGSLVDEAALYSKDVFLMLYGRHSPVGSQMFLTTMADSPYHFLKKEYMDGNDQVFEMQFGLDDNPALSDEYKDGLKSTYKGMWYDRYILGKWVAAEGIIYTSYRGGTGVGCHDYEQDIPFFDELLIGVDTGSTFPTCFEAIKKKGNQYFNEYEYYHDPGEFGQNRKTDSDLALDLRTFANSIPGASAINTRIFVDETSLNFILESRRLGLPVISATTRNPTDRVRTVDSLYAQNRLFQHKRTVKAREGNTTYVWDKHRQQQGEDLPLKKDDHAVNARDYALYMDQKHGTPGTYR